MKIFRKIKQELSILQRTAETVITVHPIKTIVILLSIIVSAKVEIRVDRLYIRKYLQTDSLNLQIL